MAIINWQNVSSSFAPGDPNALVIYWGPFAAGDEGQPIGVYAYPFVSWQFTGYSHGDLAQPNVPIMADRSVTVLGTHDNACWGEIFTLHADAAGMDARTGDPLRSGMPDGQFVNIKPIVGGSINPQGVDCGLILFCAKQFGPRP